MIEVKKKYCMNDRINQTDFINKYSSRLILNIYLNFQNATTIKSLETGFPKGYKLVVS